MDSTEQYMNNVFPNGEMGRYAVYFSDGRRIEVLADNEETATSDALSQRDEAGAYCTRVVRLKREEVEVGRNGQNNKIRDLLFPERNMRLRNRYNGR